MKLQSLLTFRMEADQDRSRYQAHDWSPAICNLPSYCRNPFALFLFWTNVAKEHETVDTLDF